MVKNAILIKPVQCAQSAVHGMRRQIIMMEQICLRTLYVTEMIVKKELQENTDSKKRRARKILQRTFIHAFFLFALFICDNLVRYFFDMAAASVLFATSTIEEVRPAIPCISEGMIILVALPSAAFVNASRLLSVITWFVGIDSFSALIPSAFACCTASIACA